MEEVLKSVKAVIDKAKHIKINRPALDFFCRHNYIDGSLNWLVSSPGILSRLPLEDQLKFVMVLNSISFCFWKLPKWNFEYKERMYDGSFGMVAALSKAIENGVPVLEFEYLAKLTIDMFEDIVCDKDRLVLKKNRVAILNDVGTIMMNEFNSDVQSLIRCANHDASLLQRLLLERFHSFKDSEVFNGQEVHFNKRAQLLTADINHLLVISGKQGLSNMECITACADYKIPYILREYGILEYSNELARLLDERTEILKGSQEEIEIRAFAIWTVEQMRCEYVKNGQHLMAFQVNDYLWLISQIKNYKYRFYHLTVTTSY